MENDNKKVVGNEGVVVEQEELKNYWITLYHNPAKHELLLTVDDESYSPCGGAYICFAHKLSQPAVDAVEIIGTFITYFDIDMDCLGFENELCFDDHNVLGTIEDVLKFCKDYSD